MVIKATIKVIKTSKLQPIGRSLIWSLRLASVTSSCYDHWPIPFNKELVNGDQGNDHPKTSQTNWRSLIWSLRLASVTSSWVMITTDHPLIKNWSMVIKRNDHQRPPNYPEVFNLIVALSLRYFQLGHDHYWPPLIKNWSMVTSNDQIKDLQPIGRSLIWSLRLASVTSSCHDHYWPPLIKNWSMVIKRNDQIKDLQPIGGL